MTFFFISTFLQLENEMLRCNLFGAFILFGVLGGSWTCDLVFDINWGKLFQMFLLFLSLFLLLLEFPIMHMPHLCSGPALLGYYYFFFFLGPLFSWLFNFGGFY